MAKKFSIKKFAAGVLAALMVVTSLPANLLSGVFFFAPQEAAVAEAASSYEVVIDGEEESLPISNTDDTIYYKTAHFEGDNAPAGNWVVVTGVESTDASAAIPNVIGVYKIAEVNIQETKGTTAVTELDLTALKGGSFNEVAVDISGLSALTTVKATGATQIESIKINGVSTLQKIQIEGLTNLKSLEITGATVLELIDADTSTAEGEYGTDSKKLDGSTGVGNTNPTEISTTKLETLIVKNSGKSGGALNLLNAGTAATKDEASGADGKIPGVALATSLKKIDLSGSTYAECTSYDIKDQTSLETLILDNAVSDSGTSGIVKIVDTNSAVSTVTAVNTKLSYLSAKNCSTLKNVYLGHADDTTGNNLTYVNLEGDMALEEIGLNNIGDGAKGVSLKTGDTDNDKEVDLTLPATGIKKLYLRNVNLKNKDLSLSAQTALEELDVVNTGISKLDLAYNSSLKKIYADYNDFSAEGSLVLPNVATMPTDLTISNCGITAIDLSKKTAIANLDVSGNYLTMLNLLSYSSTQALASSDTHSYTKASGATNYSFSGVNLENNFLTEPLTHDTDGTNNGLGILKASSDLANDAIASLQRPVYISIDAVNNALQLDTDTEKYSADEKTGFVITARTSNELGQLVDLPDTVKATLLFKVSTGQSDVSTTTGAMAGVYSFDAAGQPVSVSTALGISAGTAQGAEIEIYRADPVSSTVKKIDDQDKFGSVTVPEGIVVGLDNVNKIYAAAQTAGSASITVSAAKAYKVNASDTVAPSTQVPSTYYNIYVAPATAKAFYAVDAFPYDSNYPDASIKDKLDTTKYGKIKGKVGEDFLVDALTRKFYVDDPTKENPTFYGYTVLQDTYKVTNKSGNSSNTPSTGSARIDVTPLEAGTLTLELASEKYSEAVAKEITLPIFGGSFWAGFYLGANTYTETYAIPRGESIQIISSLDGETEVTYEEVVASEDEREAVKESGGAMSALNISIDEVAKKGEIAEVSDSGLVTAKNYGVCVIKVSSDGNEAVQGGNAYIQVVVVGKSQNATAIDNRVNVFTVKEAAKQDDGWDVVSSPSTMTAGSTTGAPVANGYGTSDSKEPDVANARYANKEDTGYTAHYLIADPGVANIRAVQDSAVNATGVKVSGAAESGTKVAGANTVAINRGISQAKESDTVGSKKGQIDITSAANAYRKNVIAVRAKKAGATILYTAIEDETVATKGSQILYSVKETSASSTKWSSLYSTEVISVPVSVDGEKLELTQDNTQIYIADQEYTGSAIEPDYIKVIYNGAELRSDEFEVEYSHNTEIGQASVTIKGLDPYSGTVVGTFNIVAPEEINENVIEEKDDTALVKDAVAESGQSEVPIEVIGEGTVYRLYDPNRGEHFYTKSVAEMQNLVQIGWVYEKDDSFDVISAYDEKAVPVYRVYNPNFGGMHFFTVSAEETKGLVQAGWTYEGISFYAYPASSNLGTPQERFRNPNSPNGEHNWTGNPEERAFNASIGWISEGIAWEIQ